MIKCGIIGCGKVGDFHARGYLKSEAAELTAVVSGHFERAEAFAKKYDGVKACRSIKEMAELGVQAVSICTPHPLHAKVAVEAIECGMHVAIEKPLASSLEDCDAILNAAAKKGVKVSTICQRRFYLPSMRVKEAIEQGKIGRPILGTVNMFGWRDEAYYNSDPWRGTWDGEGGGVLVNQAPHQLDLLLWYMGEVESVYGIQANLNHPYIEVEDTAVAVVRFKNGGIGNIVVSNSQNPALYGKVHVFGENGAGVGVQTDGGAMFVAGMSGVTEPPKVDLWTVKGEEACMEEWNKEDAKLFESPDSLYLFHERQIDDFVKAIAEDREPFITGEDGRRTVELFTAIYRATRDRKEICFPLTPEYGTDFDGRLK